MEKISGIIPSSARVAAVDMKDSPVRPGAPAFGRPQGASGKESITTNGEAMKKASEMFAHQNDWRSKDTRQAALVNEVSNAFFMKKANEPAAEAVAASEIPLQQPEGLYPRGSFIDRVA
jgi:hypothetical protein